ncbi:restriction endonuclease subunit M [Salmonella enterica subsp. enterica]|nr:restriction endonuclease subunit M [Salmonella enterica subsp. enterica]
MSKYNELVKKLKEIFQIDRPELDFGIYRILNARADEINDYLENKLKIKIQSALADAENANKADLEQQLHLAIKAATDAGFESDESPKVQEIQKKLSTITSGASEHENAVFSHLLTFFSRYYDNGDFISKRRYKGNTYAIPYAGEEVMLHWANKDQYYIKSGENFANYSFKLADGRKVSFKLLAADTAKDNRKDNDLDRCFVLIEPHVRTKFDDEGEEYEQEYKPVEVIKTSSIVDGKSVDTEELIIHFEYKAMKKGTKQETLVQSAISKILSDNNVQQHWVDLAKRVPTEKNPMRTELERHLTTYTQRNTADYFIHKDLGGFLTNELDFYIKNEVMNLDNLQNAEIFSNIEKQLRMIQCLRSVALELIAFLAQIENFQKKLWNKKKFIVSSNYTVTLDILSEELKAEALSNKNRDLFEDASSNVKNNYLINYMLQEESKNSLINTDSFQNPFKYKMDIAMDSAGATEPRCIDLIETFNYLIGLHVKSIESNVERGYVRIEGTLPTGERTLILWRDCDKIGYEELNKYANRFDLYAKEKTFDVIYINGDHNLPTAFTVDEEDGEIVRSLKIRQIEPEFLNLMFAEEV